MITPAQYSFLVEPIKEYRVQHLRGNAHLEQWDIRRHLIRCFGFGGFDIETKSVTCVAQIEHKPAKEGDKSRWTVVYTAEVRLSLKTQSGAVFAVYEDGASGDSQNQPSLGDAHDQALKTALSQALKRCAVNLGDQFGLSLYNGGRLDAVVHRSLVAPDGMPTAVPKDDAPVQPEPVQADELVGDPLAVPPAGMVTQVQLRHMHALFRELGIGGQDNREKRLALVAEILGLPGMKSSTDLTEDQANHVINGLTTRKRGGR